MPISTITANSVANNSLTTDQFASTAVHGRRNLIINGAMQVAQRGDVAGATFNYGGADRFQFISSGGAAATLSQDTDVPSNQGFSTSQKIDVTTADTSLAANDYAIIRQAIEGQNLQHLSYGTSQAKKVTLQFWVKSPKTGTHIVEIYHGDNAYTNSQAYTIASANTWQKIILTYNGYQTTALDNDNGAGLYIHWWLSAGSTYSGGTLAPNTWQNTNANRAVGQVNTTDSTSNNIYFTGVQLEVGDTATPFEHRSYGDELASCQRYYNRSLDLGNTQTGPWYNQPEQLGSGYGRAYIPFNVVMRTDPTLTVSTNNTSYTSIGTQFVTNRNFTSYLNGMSSDNYVTQWTADAEL